MRHALKPALLPVVSYLGPATAAVITGSVVIEQIFSVPGLGRFFVDGRAEPRLHARDGRRRVLRRADHRVQLPRRPRVRVARSEGEVPMSAAAAALGAQVAGPQPLGRRVGQAQAQPRGGRQRLDHRRDGRARDRRARASAATRSTSRTSPTRRSARAGRRGTFSAPTRSAATCSCARCTAAASRC